MQYQTYTRERVPPLKPAPRKDHFLCSCGTAQDERLRSFTFPAGRGAARRTQARRVSRAGGSDGGSDGDGSDDSCDDSCGDSGSDSDGSSESGRHSDGGSTCAYVDDSPQISPKTIPSMDRGDSDSGCTRSMHRAHNSVFSSFSDASSPITRHRRSSAISADKDTFSAAPRPAWPSPTKRTSDSVFNKRPAALSRPHSFSRPARVLIADTSQQLRRNSEPFFLVKAEIGRLDSSHAGPAYAGLPQTGDAAPQSIDLEPASWDRAPAGPRTPKAVQGPSALLPPIQFADVESSQEDSSTASAGGEPDPEEMLSLKEFLLTSG
ncbi:hypothetical protein ACU8KH_03144 [Lachancea thermotolerans]